MGFIVGVGVCIFARSACIFFTIYEDFTSIVPQIALAIALLAVLVKGP